MEVCINYVSWVRRPFSANVQGHSKRNDGAEWDWEMPFSDPYELIGFLTAHICKNVS
jgi:hypothetical protein